MRLPSIFYLLQSVLSIIFCSLNPMNYTTPVIRKKFKEVITLELKQIVIELKLLYYELKLIFLLLVIGIATYIIIISIINIIIVIQNSI